MVTDASNQTISYRYDLNQNVAMQVDRKGHQTRYEYDQRSMLIRKFVKETTDEIRYTYDASGNRQSMTDESGTSEYSYDENHRLVNIVKDQEEQIVYTYDAMGNISSVTDRTGYETTYTYDKSSRMETVSYDGKTTTYISGKNLLNGEKHIPPEIVNELTLIGS